MNYSMQDYKEKRCTLDEVGTEIPPIPPEENGENDAPRAQTLVGNYLKAFDRIGGVEELVNFARTNPGKFYDQLLKLLTNMNAPREAFKNETNEDALKVGDLDNMTSDDIKRALMRNQSS